jgi:hypothetical protein
MGVTTGDFEWSGHGWCVEARNDSTMPQTVPAYSVGVTSNVADGRPRAEAKYR